MHTHNQAAQRRALLLVALLVAACLAGTGLVALLRPRTSATHQDAIGYLLEQRQLAYQRVTLNRTWPDTVNSNAYAANISVQLNPLRRVNGRLECNTPTGRSCYVSLPNLAIIREPIPDLVEATPWRTRVRNLLVRWGVPVP